MKFIELTIRETNKPILINIDNIIFAREFFSYKDDCVTRLWVMPNAEYIEVLEPYDEIRKLLAPNLEDCVNKVYGDSE